MKATDTVAYLSRRVRKPCSSPKCTRIVQTDSTVRAPRCRPCRRRMKAIEKARQASLDARQLLRVSWLVQELERALDQTDTRMQLDMLPHRNRHTR